MNIRKQVFRLLSSGTAYPVFGSVAPSTAVSPYIVFSVISDILNYTHAGFDNTARTRIQASAYSTVSYASAVDVAGAIISALNAAPGSYGIAIARMENELDLYNEDSKTHHIPVDFIINRETYSTAT